MSKLIRENEQNKTICMEDKSIKMMCEVIHDYWVETTGTSPEPEEIFGYSPTGELSNVFLWYWEAKAHFTGLEPSVSDNGDISWGMDQPGDGTE